jgi:hypothetical protein
VEHGEAAPEGLVSEIENILISQGRACDREVAKVRHDQLFAFVMRLLAKRKSKTQKRIDSKCLDRCLRSLAISAHDAQILSELAGIKSMLGGSVSEIRDDLAILKEDTAAIRAQLTTSAGATNGLVLRPVVDEGPFENHSRQHLPHC